MQHVEEARRRYAEHLRKICSLQSAALTEAFATVPREHYLGPGPWLMLETFPNGYRETPDTDPAHLYRDVPVAIDASRLLNNGQPAFVAFLIDALALQPGEHVVHVGCGTGYFTAIIAEVVGATGHVTAVDIDADLAARARRNLSGYSHVEVITGDGGDVVLEPAHAMLINAGATHIRPLWLDRLRPGGRLIVPLVRWPSRVEERSASGTGIVVKVTHGAEGDAARVLTSCVIFPCIGGIDADADQRLASALSRMEESDSVRSLRRDAHAAEPTCWLHGDGFCLSTRPVSPK